ncbi:M61 family metallopeptidase [Alysiella filiformis]|uniref:Predicted metalloprotease, contains C-terminal PDZ domain n=1 Tax=Alysiella filiformis DSM 16848 TaxID=1120981 RepID=A0A286E539_9NEIS|nr:PDZ domain-containing protein [Alysiella filiformis]QMT30426.1 M61 family metallopeptidase [Alysiella filiformis]UBQ56593.1 PDZ domain-containing protein [Alysiella filiformis DSM 16848]SOD65999.1 Predicted metalloprotease, contains C-terminal PDZ domain [Alysiella filiformis DSM 16848]
MFHYTLIPQPQQHIWHITLSFDHIAGSPNLLKLANWVAGSYMIRDFSRHILGFQAACNGEDCEMYQLDKNTWQLPDQDGHYVVHYAVYANDLSVRASLLDTQRGFIDGACLFLYAPHRQNEVHEVELAGLPENWQIVSTLPRISETHFQATSYAELTDHPIEMGEHIEILRFEAHSIPHFIALSGYYRDFDRQRLIDDCQRICEYEIDLFPRPTPFTHYLFLLYLGDGIYGGLEHISSTALHADRKALPAYNMGEANAAYTELLGLIAHEYFHAWNVKSFKPTVFQPYDLEKETYTEQLWAYEGITSYYDDLTLVRSGVISVSNYLNLLANTMTRVQRNAGRKWQSLAQSSFAAWHKYYKQDENSPNAITSYYQHGALFALCLDLVIRENSEYSLDFVMQNLYQRFLDTGAGTQEGEWQTLASEYTGLTLNDFFNYGLYSTEDLPLAMCLRQAGIELRWLPENRSSGNGKLVSEFPDFAPQAELGCRYTQNKDGAVISHVFSGSSAEEATLKPNDKIIAVNGLACTDFAAQTQTAVGDVHVLHFFREGVLRHTELTVQAAEPHTAYLKIVDEDLLQQWLFNQKSQ